MSEFDDFYKQHDENNYSVEDFSRLAFDEAWIIQQAEIDELQRKYDAMYNAFTYSDDCRKEWHESYMRLKSRISEALDMLEGRQGKVLLDDIVDILKGTTNE